MKRFLPILLLVVAAAGLALAGLATARSGQAEPTRADLAAGQPGFAPGYRLSLMKVTIPAGARLIPHRHPGMQTARVMSGRLEYRVVRGGSVTVYRGAADSTKKRVRTIKPGQTVVIEPGQWITEAPGLWHAGANPGDKPTVILIAALLKSNEPVSIPLEP